MRSNGDMAPIVGNHTCLLASADVGDAGAPDQRNGITGVQVSDLNKVQSKAVSLEAGV